MKNTFIYLFILIAFSSFGQEISNIKPCEFSKVVLPNQPVQDTLQFKDFATTCNFSVTRGKWFKIIGTGEVFSIKTSYERLDVYTGSCDSLVCEYFFNQPFLTTKDKVYYLLFHKDLNEFKPIPIQFEVESWTAPIGNDKNNPIKVSCGDEVTIDFSKFGINENFKLCPLIKPIVWLSFIGDGKVFNINRDFNKFFSLYAVFGTENGNCKFKSFDYENISISTEIGKSYTLGLAWNGGDGLMDLTFLCIDSNFPSTCDKATEITCSDNRIDLIQHSLIDTNLNFSNWIYLKGDSTYHNLIFEQLLYPTTINLYELDSFSNCNDKILIKSYSERINNLGFFAQPNKFYLINILSQFKENFVIIDFCQNYNPQNKNCLNAEELSCGTTIENNNSIWTNEISIENNIFNSSLWYKYNGSSGPMKIKSGGRFGNADILFFEENCDTLKFIKAVQFYAYEGYDLYLFPDERKNYFISFGQSKFSSDSRLVVDCEDEWDKERFRCGDKTIDCNETKASTKRRGLRIDIDDKSYDQVLDNSEVYWYSHKGDGNVLSSFWNFDKYTVYKGSCDTLIEIPRYEYIGENYLQFKTEVGEDYRIKCSNRFGYLNDIVEISLKCFSIKENVECDAAFELPCKDTTFILNASEVIINLEDVDCLEKGYLTQWFKIVGNDMLYSLKMDNYTQNMNLFEGDCDNLICKQDSLYSLEVGAEIGKEYFIAVQAPSITGSLLTINCSNRISNSFCGGSLPIMCGDSIKLSFKSSEEIIKTSDATFKSLWYKIEGNEENLELTFFNVWGNGIFGAFQVYENDCNTLLYSSYIGSIPKINFINKIKFFAKMGVSYSIRIMASSDQQDLTAIARCFPKVGDASSCFNPIQLSCGVEASYNTAKDELVDAYYYNLTFPNSKWYSLPNDSGNYLVKKSGTNNPFVYFSLVRYKETCDSIKQLESFQLNENSYYISTDTFFKYFLVLYNQTDFLDSLTFSIECEESTLNTSCESSKQIDCGKEYFINLEESLKDNFGGCTLEEKGAWFSLIGDGNIFKFDVVDNVKMYVSESNCDSLSLDNAIKSQNNTGFSLETKLGVIYKLKITSDFYKFIKFKVSCFDPVVNYDCSSPKMLNCGDSIVQLIGTKLPSTDNVCQIMESGLYYDFTGNGQIFKLIFETRSTSNFTVYIIEKSCIDGRCLFKTNASQLRNEILLDTRKNTNYIIAITGLYGDIVKFKTECYDFIENTDCLNPNLISCGDTLQCSIIPPLGANFNHPCVFIPNAVQNWFLLPKGKKILELSAISTNNQAYNVVLIQGNCDQYSCLGTYSSTSNQRNILKILDPKLDHYAVVFGDYQTFSDIVLKLECLEPSNNDDCRNAEIINCGDTTTADFSNATASLDENQIGCSNNFGYDLWYKIIGNGKVLDINYEPANNVYVEASLLETDCNSFKCLAFSFWTLSNPSGLRIRTEVGKEYFLKLSANQSSFPFVKFFTNCFEALPNDNCEGALPFNINGSNDLELGMMTDDIISTCNVNFTRGAWYTFIGNDSIVTLKSNAPATLTFSLFSGECGNFECLQASSLQNYSSFTFSTEKNRKYYLLLSYEPNAPIIPINISATSSFRIANDVCSNSKNIVCGDTIKFNSSSVTKDFPIGNPCQDDFSNTAWYLFESSGETLIIEQLDNSSKGLLKILNACNGSCLYNAQFYQKGIISVNGTIKGQSYYISFGLYPTNESYNSEFKINCKQGTKNNSKLNADTLKCGTYTIDLSKGKPTFKDDCFYNWASVHYYKLTGNDSLLQIDKSFSNFGTSLIIVDQSCTIMHDFSFGNTYKTKKGEEYFFLVIHNPIDVQDFFSFDVKFNCIIDNLSEPLTLPNLKIEPNPFIEDLNISFTSKENENLSFNFYDMGGKLVYQTNRLVFEGNQTVTINSKEANLKSGMYLFEIRNKESFVSKKIFKIE